MKWFSNVLETYGYLTTSLTGQKQAERPAVALDGSLIARPVRERYKSACQTAASTGVLVDGLSELSLRAGSNQFVISGSQSHFAQMADDQILLANVGGKIAFDGRFPLHAAWHQAIFQRTEHQAVMITPGVYAAVLAAHRRLPSRDLLEVNVIVNGVSEAAAPSLSNWLLRGDGLLIPQVGMMVMGESLANCFLLAAQIERWCQISWLAHGLELPEFGDTLD